MLLVTENAAEAIKAITSTSEAPEGAGLRISAQELGDGQAGLELALVTGPAESDQVVEAEGAQLFLEPTAASFLDGKLLDASIEGDEVRFAIAPQPGPDGNGPTG